MIIQFTNKNQPPEVALRLEAEGLPGLYPLLTAASGSLLAERFYIRDLFAVGREGFLFVATDQETGAEVLVKQAAFDYRDTMRYSRRQCEAMRAPLLVEAEVLRACRSGHMSRLVSLLRAPAIVPEAKRSSALQKEEIFVVQEKLDARTLTEVALQRWPSYSAAKREQAAAHLASSFVRFWESLRTQGWLYTDVNANNLLLGDDERLWVVDAASAIPAAERVRLSAIAPAFSTPRLWEKFQARQEIVGDLSMVLPLLGKTLHFALTGLSPHNAALPDLDTLSEYTPFASMALSACFALDTRPSAIEEATASIQRWVDAVG